MQSIFRLPWCSDPIASKLSENAALDKMRPTPTVEIPVLNKLKRKRAISSEGSPLRAPDNKKPRPYGYDSQLPNQDSKPKVQQVEGPQNAASQIETAHALPTQLLPSSSDSTSTDLTRDPPATANMDTSMDEPMLDTTTDASADVFGFTPLQQVIENEFNMQILTKHNELRLIEQELAKCQVALEQLRRCELRPYPGSNGLSAAVSAGTGPALAPPPGCSRPSHPAPYGVTDGPYTKHYRNWLLQDSSFDAAPLHLLEPESAGRPTRNSGPARRSVGQPFTFPGRSAERIPSLPSFPAPPPKEKNQPNVLRRSTDGQLVKLICNNCQRGNFSSIQGFLNHCRIAHKVDYKSHDAAAIDCGRPLEEGEAASLPAEPIHTPAPKPTSNRATPATMTTNRNLIHPFNASTGAALVANQHQQPNIALQPARSLSLVSAPTAQTSFTPSAQVPRLSAYFDKHQIGGDLARAAIEAKQKVDLGVEEDLPSPDVSEQNSPLEAASAFRTVTSGRTGSLGINSASVSRPPGRKAFRQPMQQSKARPSPLVPIQATAGAAQQEQSELPDSPNSHGRSVDLSPHTADSNPGLVSDHEDDDQGSASESEDVPVPQPHASRQLPVNGHRPSCSENMEIHVAVEDGVDGDGVVIRRNSLSTDEHARRSEAKFGPPGKRLM